MIWVQNFSHLYLTILENCQLFSPRAVDVAKWKLQKDSNLEDKLHVEPCLGHGGNWTNTYCMNEQRLVSPEWTSFFSYVRSYL